MTTRWMGKTRERLEEFYDELRRILQGQIRRLFPKGNSGEVEDRADEAAALVTISILARRPSIRLLATTCSPLAYLLKCGWNVLRHAPPKKSILLLKSEPIEADGTTPSGAAPTTSVMNPTDGLLIQELRSKIALYPQPKRAIFVLWMHGFTSREIARTIRVTAANARYHISRMRAELQRRGTGAA